MTFVQQEKDISVCSRLREERKASGLDQQGVADALGVTAKTVGRWEKNVPIPSDKLAALAAHGVDVLYVVTGQRSLTASDSLSKAEDTLLANYRQLDEKGRATVHDVTHALAKAALLTK